MPFHLSPDLCGFQKPVSPFAACVPLSLPSLPIVNHTPPKTSLDPAGNDMRNNHIVYLAEEQVSGNGFFDLEHTLLPQSSQPGRSLRDFNSSTNPPGNSSPSRYWRDAGSATSFSSQSSFSSSAALSTGFIDHFPISPSPSILSSDTVIDDPWSRALSPSSSSSASQGSSSTDWRVSQPQLQESMANECVGMNAKRDPLQQHAKQAVHVDKADQLRNEHNISGVSIDSVGGEEEEKDSEKQSEDEHAKKRTKRQPPQHRYRGNDLASASSKPADAISNWSTAVLAWLPAVTSVSNQEIIRVWFSPPECIKQAVFRLKQKLEEQLLAGLKCVHQEPSRTGHPRYFCRFCGRWSGAQLPTTTASVEASSRKSKPRAWCKIAALKHILPCLREKQCKDALWMRQLWPYLVAAFGSPCKHENCANLRCYSKAIEDAQLVLNWLLGQHWSPSAQEMSVSGVPEAGQNEVLALPVQYYHTVALPYTSTPAATSGNHHPVHVVGTQPHVAQLQLASWLYVCLDRGHGEPFRTGRIEVVQDTMDGTQLVRLALQAILLPPELAESGLNWRCTALLEDGVALRWHPLTGGPDFPLAVVTTSSSPAVQLINRPPGHALKLQVLPTRSTQQSDHHPREADNDQSRDGKREDGDERSRCDPHASNPFAVVGKSSASSTSQSTIHSPPPHQRNAAADEAVSAPPLFSQWALEQLQFVHPALSMSVTQWAEEQQCRPLLEWIKVLQLLSAEHLAEGGRTDAGQCGDSDMEEEEEEEEQQEQEEDEKEEQDSERMADQHNEWLRPHRATSAEGMTDVDHNSDDNEKKKWVRPSAVEHDAQQDDNTSVSKLAMVGRGKPSPRIFHTPGLSELDAEAVEGNKREVEAAFVQVSLSEATYDNMFSATNGTLMETCTEQQVEQDCDMHDDTTQRVHEAARSSTASSAAAASSVPAAPRAGTSSTVSASAPTPSCHDRYSTDPAHLQSEAVCSSTGAAAAVLDWPRTKVRVQLLCGTTGSFAASLGFLERLRNLQGRPFQRHPDFIQNIIEHRRQRSVAFTTFSSPLMGGWTAGLPPWCTLFDFHSSDQAGGHAQRRTFEESRRVREQHQHPAPPASASHRPHRHCRPNNLRSVPDTQHQRSLTDSINCQAPTLPSLLPRLNELSLDSPSSTAPLFDSLLLAMSLEEEGRLDGLTQSFDANLMVERGVNWILEDDCQRQLHPLSAWAPCDAGFCNGADQDKQPPPSPPPSSAVYYPSTMFSLTAASSVFSSSIASISDAFWRCTEILDRQPSRAVWPITEDRGSSLAEMMQGTGGRNCTREEPPSKHGDEEKDDGMQQIGQPYADKDGNQRFLGRNWSQLTGKPGEAQQQQHGGSSQPLLFAAAATMRLRLGISKRFAEVGLINDEGSKRSRAISSASGNSSSSSSFQSSLISPFSSSPVSPSLAATSSSASSSSLSNFDTCHNSPAACSDSKNSSTDLVPSCARIINRGYVQPFHAGELMATGFHFPIPAGPCIVRQRRSARPGDGVVYQSIGFEGCKRCQRPFSSSTNAEAHHCTLSHSNLDPIYVRYEERTGEWVWFHRARRATSRRASNATDRTRY